MMEGELRLLTAFEVPTGKQWNTQDAEFQSD
jgi:hypothetical protein